MQKQEQEELNMDKNSREYKRRMNLEQLRLQQEYLDKEEQLKVNGDISGLAQKRIKYHEMRSDPDKYAIRREKNREYARRH